MTDAGRRRDLLRLSLSALGITALVAGSSLVGAAVVAVLDLVLLASPHDLGPHRVALLLLPLVFVPIAVVVGTATGWLLQRSTIRWVAANRVPTREEARRAVRLPAQVTAVSGALWATGTVVIGIANAVLGDAEAARRAFLSIGLGGFTTCGIAYLLSERAARPMLAVALAAHPKRSMWSAGVGTRLVVTWLVTTGVVLLGIVLVVTTPAPDRQDTDAAVLALAALGLTVGAGATALLARSVGTPLRHIRDALDRIGDGRLDVNLEVDDGSEIGLLQSGVNAMVDSIRERERTRDLFERHVGRDVAEAALTTGVTLAGELRHVVALFVDVIGSTALATQVSPQEVVARLNRLFEVVVTEVSAAGGLVNKFQGDAALCVFGAPAPHDDPATAAVHVARAIRDAVQARGELDVSVGIACGEAVAGQLGAAERLEWTVIGDPVNEAARLGELAKTMPGRIAASSDVIHAAGDPDGWTRTDTTRLRGRDRDTEVWSAPTTGSAQNGM
ncbi:MAG TPA: adenylate/guanylate cyclase domain-containing protein [Mycobacteriales bacterium]|nr:adenylate/guanylate cyclase domain-containing protein [Mycobacteriales bacterium]